VKKRVAIICGGRSSEHEISCISASGVIAAIDREEFDPILIGISKSGAWILLKDATDFVAGESGLPSDVTAFSQTRMIRQMYLRMFLSV
jgi:D-alanine-D-alanine ligase